MKQDSSRKKCICGRCLLKKNMKRHLGTTIHSKNLKGGSKTTKKNKKVDLSTVINTDKYAKNGFDKYDPTKTKLAKINADPEKLDAVIDKMKKDGRVEINKLKELKNFPLGSLVSYITKEGLYRSGGMLKAIKPDYFVLHGGTQQKPISFSVQFNKVKTMFVKNPRAKITKEPVESEDERGED